MVPCAQNFIKPYGLCRLGHREQKDEWVPRRVEVFQNRNLLPPDAIVSAGSVSSSCTAGMLLRLKYEYEYFSSG